MGGIHARPFLQIARGFFLSAMRHFAQSLRDRKMPLLYHRIDEASEAGSLGKALASDIQRLHPTQVVCLEPGGMESQGGHGERPVESLGSH